MREVAITRKGRYLVGWSGDAFFFFKLSVQVIRSRKTVYLEWWKRSGQIKTCKVRWW